MKRQSPSPVDLRLYRFAWIPAVLALVVLMFSFVGTPDGLEPATPPTAFEDTRAATEARRVAELAPQRTAGSEGDELIADRVAAAFGEIPAGLVTEQDFDAEVDGEEVEARNVWVTLPGESTRTIAVIAARDSPEGPGAASSAAATGALIELASALGVSGHEKTFVLASTSGDAEGAAGTRALLDELASDEIEAVIVLSQPGVPGPSAPYVVNTSTSTASGSAQLERTAELAVEAQLQLESAESGALTQLARLAIPSGLGAQAPLVGDGIPAVRLSGAGERRIEAESDVAGEASGKNTAAFGRAALAIVNALDVNPSELEDGPRTHLELSENFVPGWTLAVLALTLLLPALVATIDACARCARAREPLLAGLGWAATRALPFVGGLALLYFLALVGVVPTPSFPFDPRLQEPGALGIVAIALIVIAVIASALALRRGPRRVTGGAASAGVGAVSAIAGLALWLANPYLALLAAPIAHVWVLAASGGGLGRAVICAVAAAAATVPVIAALAIVAGELDLGAGSPWIFLLMVADGQIGLWVMVPACLLAGSLVGSVALAIARRGQPSPVAG